MSAEEGDATDPEMPTLIPAEPHSRRVAPKHKGLRRANRVKQIPLPAQLAMQDPFAAKPAARLGGHLGGSSGGSACSTMLAPDDNEKDVEVADDEEDLVRMVTQLMGDYSSSSSSSPPPPRSSKLDEHEHQQLSRSSGGAQGKKEEDKEEEEEEEELELAKAVALLVRDLTQMRSAKEFSSYLRLQGLSGASAVSRMHALAQALVEACRVGLENLGAVPPAQRPRAAAEALEDRASGWAPVLRALWSEAGAEAAVAALSFGSLRAVDGLPALRKEELRDCIEVGMLMAMREQLEDEQDWELLAGSRRLLGSGRRAGGEILQKFVASLERDVEEAAAADAADRNLDP